MTIRFRLWEGFDCSLDGLLVFFRVDGDGKETLCCLLEGLLRKVQCQNFSSHRTKDIVVEDSVPMTPVQGHFVYELAKCCLRSTSAVVCT